MHEDGDALVSARLTNGKNDVFLAAKSGMCIRFNEEDVRSMGRVARGVYGMDLDQGDNVVAMEVLERDEGHARGFEILVVTETGYGKRTPVSEYRLQGRGGLGIKAMKLNSDRGRLVGGMVVSEGDEVLAIKQSGQITRSPVNGVRALGRDTMGVKFVGVAGGSAFPAPDAAELRS